jgi:AcrR family transcriptional regulator
MPDRQPTTAEGTNPQSTNPQGTNPQGTKPKSTKPQGTKPRGTKPQGSNTRRSDPGGSDPEGSDALGGNAAGGNAQPARRRNPRGQGERLRDEIIEAASRLLADPAAPPLTLRAVAREVGVAATSVYLHFDDIESLVLAVADRRFGELVQMQDTARTEGTDPRQQLLEGCLAYCEFGLSHPGHYQVMFTSQLPLPEWATPEQMPGYRPFQKLINIVAECIGVTLDNPEAFFTAHLIWQQLHGIVSLRISRPKFPWPPLPADVTASVDRLLADARPGPR